MPQFYFHIRDHDKLIPDLEGVEMPGARAALEEAKDAAREILAAQVRRGDVIDGHEFEVWDELGTKLFTVPFRSVLKFD
ncbi:hypothetical protein IHQ71_30830 (plasmid) [Rhizobium sp. TH2]|uniref:DUF6894 family protein n=1 Tax=Rhizobium sp. TH2 TaxID=2775403 RepID=UPI0021578CFC|nr:hypothetical protein [Rhizobium sp. TH2]UVC12399.1 hypothetical protein IHQ71_30830 [Rhizobium sp. TH2]